MSTLNTLGVEILVNGVWTDITADVDVRQGGAINISRGQRSEGDSTDPGSCSFLINNASGKYSPDYPLSVNYGLLQRNTQVRVYVLKADGTTRSYRFWGEIPSWPEVWDGTGRDYYVQINAVGILSRLRTGTTPLGSTMFRGLTGPSALGVVAYWPMEDGSLSTSIASAIGGPPMVFSAGTPNLSADSSFLSSQALPVMNSSRLVGAVPAYTVTGQTQVRYLQYLPTALPSPTQVVKVKASGTVPYWVVQFDSSASLSLKGVDADGVTTLWDSGAIGFQAVGKHYRVSMELTQSGSNVTWTLGAVDCTTGVNAQITGSFTGVGAVGAVTQVTVTPGLTASDTVIGHVSVQNQVTSAFDLSGQASAFVGEWSGNRFTRLCNEQGVNNTYFSPLPTDVMGAQTPDTFPNLIDEVLKVDTGILVERELALGLALRGRASIYSQSATAVLDYFTSQLSEPPLPQPDTQNLRNQITASQPRGTTFVAEQDTGPLSVTAVGVYPDAPSLNLWHDTDLPAHAQWMLSLGTVAEPRYPSMTVNLRRSQISNALRDNVLALLPGNRLDITNPPSRVGHTISQVVIGIQETLNQFMHILTFTGRPWTPWAVGVLDDAVLGHLDTGGSQLAVAAGSADTTLYVDNLVADYWSTNTGVDYPFGLTCSGEQMTATACSNGVTDAFTRTTSSGWGNATSGQTWAKTGGLAADYSTNGTKGVLSLATVNVSRNSTIPLTAAGGLCADFDVVATLTSPVLSSGASHYLTMLGRFIDGSNFYNARVELTTANAVILTIRKTVAGTATMLATFTTGWTHAANTQYRVRFAGSGTNLMAKVWPVGQSEPYWMVTATDSSLTAGGSTGVQALLGSGSTNTLPVNVTVDDFAQLNPQAMTVTRSVNGIVKALPAASPISLTNPMTLGL